jgi:hypothetical protein
MEALLDLLGEQDLGKRLAARPSAPGDRATRPSPVRVTAPGTGIPGAVHRSDVDARVTATSGVISVVSPFLAHALLAVMGRTARAARS